MELIQKTGIVERWFNGEGGYGFINPDDGGEEVFVHHTDIQRHSEVLNLDLVAAMSEPSARIPGRDLRECPG